MFLRSLLIVGILGHPLGVTLMQRWKLAPYIFPKAVQYPSVHAQGRVKILKRIVCLEACKRLHGIGALTDNLVPDIVKEEAAGQDLGNLHA